MNTKQLAVLWYIALIVLLSLLGGWGIRVIEYSVSAKIVIGVIILGCLIIFSFSNRVQIDKTLFIKLTGIPIILTIGFIFWVIYINSNLSTEKLPNSALAKIKLSEDTHTGSDGDTFGHIYNGSSYTLTQIVFQITANPVPVKGWEDAPNATGFVPPPDAVVQDNSWARKYNLNTYIKPFSSQIFELQLSDTKNKLLNYKIVGVRGRK